MSIHLERGRLLLEQGRYKMAKKELQQELAQFPNNAYAMGLLAVCHSRDKEHEEAINLIERAVGIDPENTYLFYLQATIYLYSNKLDKAKTAAQNGLTLNPNEPALFQVRGSIALMEDQWEEALDNAERGLELDPEDLDLVNLRARALIQLNRQSEAAATLNYALHKSPENAQAHTNKGWVAIENDQYEVAVTHFKEALRLDPTFAFAQTGLKEAIKAKNILYRYVLKFFLWTSKMTDKGRWALIIGLYIIYRIIISLAQNYPGIAPLLYPLIAAYILFAFSSWIATPFSNLFLRLHPLGKLALTDDEKLGSNLVGLFLLCGIICFVSYFVVGLEILVILGAWFILMLIPLGGVFATDHQSKGRKYLIYYSSLLGAIGLGYILMPALEIFLIIFALGIFFYAWVANYLIMKGAKEF